MKRILFIIGILLLLASPAWATEVSSSIAASGDIAHPTVTDAGAGPTYIYYPYSSDTRRMFMRFKIAVPKNATIESAYVKVYSYGNHTNDSVMTVNLTDEDNATAFSTTAYARSVTATTVTWTISSAWTAGTQYTSADLKSLIQEWVQRENYVPNAYVGLRFKYSSGEFRTAYAWGDSEKVAQLVVTYSGGDPDMRVYMPEPHSRTKSPIRGEFMFQRSTDQWKISLDNVQVYLKSSDLTATENYTIDYTSLTAGEHHVDVEMLDEEDSVLSSYTKTWTTLHDGAPTVGIDENNSFILGGTTLTFPILSYLTYAAHAYNTYGSDQIVNGVHAMGYDSGNLNYGPTQFATYLSAQDTASMKGSGPGMYNFVYPWFSSGWPRYHVMNMRDSGGNLLSETFEGPGYTLAVCGGETTTNCWTEVSGTITDDYGTGPLVGSYSAKLDGTVTEAVMRYTLSRPNSIVAFKFAMKDTAESRVATDLIRFRNGASEVANDLVGKLVWNADGTLTAHHCVLANDTAECSTTANNKLSGSTVYSVGTTYYVWVLWDSTQSTYNQGTMKVWVSTSATDPTAGTPEINIVYSGENGGSGQGAIQYVDLVSKTTLLYDNFAYWGTDMRAFVDAAKTNAGLLFYSFDDEPDLGCSATVTHKCLKANHIKIWKDYIHTLDTNHPHIENFTGGIISPTFSTASQQYGKELLCGTDENYALIGERVNVVDALMFDSYPYEYWRYFAGTDLVSTVGSIDNAYKWSKKTVPVIIFLETVDLHDNYGANTYLNIASWDSGTWAAGDTVTGQASGATATIPTPSGNITIANYVRTSTNLLVTTKGNATAFSSGEQVIGSPSGAVATLGNPAKDTGRPFGTTKTYDWTPPPTDAQMKNLYWISVIHGAKGVAHFQYFGNKETLKPASLEFKKTVDDLKNAVLAAVSDKCTPAETDVAYCAGTATGARVDYTVREYDGNIYVFAARVNRTTDANPWPDATNDDSKSATLSITGLAAETNVAVYGESRALSAGAGTITDNFLDYDVHIYVIGEIGEPPDEVAPTVEISTDDPTTVAASSTTILGTAADLIGVDSCKWRIGSAPDADNGTSCTGTTSWSCAVTGLVGGANTVYVGCADAAANWGNDSLTVNWTMKLPWRTP